MADSLLSNDASQRAALLMSIKDAQRHLQHLFPSQGSFEWHLRNHKAEYAAAGALFLIAGRLLVDAKKFESLALSNGLRDARKHYGVSASSAPQPPAEILSAPITDDAALPFLREIVLRGQKFDGCCGVYFLIELEDVVYVGQSKNVYARVADHRNQQSIAFDKWAFIPCDAQQLLIVEAHYIRTLRPRHNKAVPS